ncbi:MAG: DUF4390 domain-containing protein [Xanthomonadales bacterium]
MPGYARHPERRAAVLAGVLALGLCGGCGAPPEAARFAIDDLTATWSNGTVDIRIEQRVDLGEAARDALQHSVPLTITLELVLRGAESRSRLHRVLRHYEIRYLPLSQRWQLRDGDDGPTRTFPRLRHVLAELGRVNLSFRTGPLPAGVYELLARSYLDQERMPPPMRLPALFSERWDHASGWTAWPLEVEPGV